MNVPALGAVQSVMVPASPEVVPLPSPPMTTPILGNNSTPADTPNLSTSASNIIISPPVTNKQFILIIDTSSSMQSHFNEISNSILLPILQKFFMDNQKEKEQGSSSGVVDMALIVFRDYIPCAEYLIRSTPFTTDLREFRLWLQSVNTSFGDTASILNTRPTAEPLCAALKLSKQKDAKEKHVILITNSDPSEASCRSCHLLGDAHAHAARLAKAKVLLSIIAPRPLESLQKLFQSGKPDEEVPVVTKQTGMHMQLLRGISTNQPAAAAPPLASGPAAAHPVDVKQQPVTTIATSKDRPTKPLWEGPVAWQHTPSTVVCELAAYTTQLRPEADLSVYGISDWPAALTIAGVVPAKDPHITQHFKSAKFIELVPLRREPNSENQYKTFFLQLAQKSMAAVVYLPSKTLLVLPHNETKKLLGLVLPKLVLAPRTGTTATTAVANPAAEVPKVGAPVGVAPVNQPKTPPNPAYTMGNPFAAKPVATVPVNSVASAPAVANLNVPFTGAPNTAMMFGAPNPTVPFQPTPQANYRTNPYVANATQGANPGFPQQ
eukprot:TRINITY_DN2166_c0_g1_i1.p1 TRINITY_DN2166_c0_g1~~TRINITY_DN2166_c0_g1_i1.p1  ORF type:complete len:550 (+),score=49.85 TRINITY_DN2166_c0_g1_i1:167-1816(+)